MTHFFYNPRKEDMDTDLCIGILTKKNVLEVVAIERGKITVALAFPVSRMGIEAIKGFLASRDASIIRLAVAGAAALSVALALGNAPGTEVFIVSSVVADQAMALARYARQAV